MSQVSEMQVKNSFSKFLSQGENLVTIGIFKRIPSVTWLLLTKGMAWILTEKFFVGVTDKRLVILPESTVKGLSGKGEPIIYAGFDEVAFTTDPLNNTILEVDKTYRNEPLKLRFYTCYQIEGMDQFDFIADVKQRKKHDKVSEES